MDGQFFNFLCMLKYITLFFIILNIFNLKSQTYHIRLQSEKPMSGVFILKDIRQTPEDTIIFSQLTGNAMSLTYSISTQNSDGTILPLVFELNGAGDRNFSGMLITDSLDITLNPQEGALAIRGSIQNEWYYHLIDSVNYYFSQKKEESEDSLRSKIVHLLCIDTLPERAEIYGIFLYQFLAMGFVPEKNLDTAKEYLSKLPERYWPQKALELIRKQSVTLRKKLEVIDNSRTLYLDSLHTKRFILIDFWASWCGPCLAAIPKLKVLYESQKDELNIVSISLDKNETAWISANTRLNLPWFSFLDHSDLNKSLEYLLNITSIPTLLLFDHDWNLLYRGNDLNTIKTILEH